MQRLRLLRRRDGPGLLSPDVRVARERSLGRVTVLLGVVLGVLLGAVGSASLGPAEPQAVTAAPPRATLVPAPAGSSSPSESPYPVTFAETGLPGGSGWAVIVNSHLNASSGPSIVVPLINGTYSYSVAAHANFTPLANASGTVTVAGAPVTVNVTFAEEFNLIFNETGLVVGPGVLWQTLVGGKEQSASPGQNIVWRLTNSTYSYSILSSTGAVPHPQVGQATIQGYDVRVNITFTPRPPSYLVTFVERGLPTGTNWYATVQGTPAPTPARAPSNLTFLEPNGSYTFSAGADNGYVSHPAAGAFDVVGTPVVVNLTFYPPPTYTVTFVETGLTGGSWNITIAGVGSRAAVGGGSISFSLENGTYGFTAGSWATYHPTPASGILTVIGSAQSIPIAYSTNLFVVTFYELGLATGTWWVAINGTNQSASVGFGLSVLLPNGSYAFTSGASSNYTAKPNASSLLVAGASVTLGISFDPPKNLTGTTGPSAPPSTLQRLLLYAIAGTGVVVVILAAVILRHRLFTTPRPPPPEDGVPPL